MKTLIAMLVSSFGALGAMALEIRFEPVAEGIYAHIGDKGGRTVENEGLNANIGLVVTPGGAVLIDSGSTAQVARRIEEAVARVTKEPIRWVINTGGQDHRWLGNGHFAAKGAQVISHAKAPDDMQSRGGDQLAALRSLLGARVEGTVPAMPTRLIDGEEARLDLGGTAFTLVHRGGGHTPGDMMVWLPKARVLFTGDIVYVDRMLAVIPVSNTKRWLAAFDAAEALAPARIVPGHGGLTDLATASAHTRDYLLALRKHMKRATDEGTDVGEAVKTFDAKPFMHLLNAAELAGGNANRVYLEIERE